MSEKEELDPRESVSEEEAYDYEVFTGVVEWFGIERGYGFIGWSKEGVKQKDMFCHFSDIDTDGFKLLKGGQTVTFSVGTNNEGVPKAINVKITG